ncbi:MAG: hypothetical protein WCJ84_01630 [Candidatus Peregrinibacteria bacterium]
MTSLEGPPPTERRLNIAETPPVDRLAVLQENIGKSFPTDAECDLFTAQMEGQQQKIKNFLLHDGEYQTIVNQGVLGWTNQQKLEDWQKLILAPANSIENVIASIGNIVISPFTEEGRSSIMQGFQAIQQSPKIVQDIFSVFWNALTPAEKSTVLLEMASGSAFTYSLITKISKMIKVMNREGPKNVSLTKRLSLASAVGAGLNPAVSVAQTVNSAQNLHEAKKASQE